MATEAPNLLQQVILLVISPQCYDKYFSQFDFLDGPCFSATLSKCLGLGIILGSVLVKLPQILKIWRSKSGEGISLISVSLDLTAITLYAAYSYLKGFPFSAWGDTSCLAVQTVIIGALVLFYADQTLYAIWYLLGYGAILYVLTSGLTPVEVLWTLQGFNIFIVLSGKLSQAFINYKNGNTGQLSAVTVLMLFLGSVARIFTSIQETGDQMAILTYVVSSFANAVVLSQVAYYWNVPQKKEKKL